MNKIKELRKEKNITVAELAKELGISQSMLTNYENGNGTPRDESIWEKLSQIFGVSKSHVMGLTTDIETANKTKQLKVVVDTSQPISIQPKNQTDLDVLIKLDLIDSEDMEEVSAFLDKLLAQEKYEGRRESNVKYVVGLNIIFSPLTAAEIWSVIFTEFCNVTALSILAPLLPDTVSPLLLWISLASAEPAYMPTVGSATVIAASIPIKSCFLIIRHFLPLKACANIRTSR